MGSEQGSANMDLRPNQGRKELPFVLDLLPCPRRLHARSWWALSGGYLKDMFSCSCLVSRG